MKRKPTSEESIRNPRAPGRLWLAAVASAALALTACVIDDGPGATGRFEQTLEVPSRVRIELRNGSGDTMITAGAPGKVRIEAEVRGSGMFGEESRRVEQVKSNPPVSLSGSLLRIGPSPISNVRITYRIEAPPDAVLDVQSGSGDVEASGVEGPVRLHIGSGDVRAWAIRQAVDLSTGSGDVGLRDAGGRADAVTGSGDMEFEQITGALRARTSSGDVVVRRVAGRIDVRTGSGSVEIAHASASLRAETGSGDCSIEGDPPAQATWEISTGSGDVRLDVPGTASFLLHVRGRINEMENDLPIEIQESSRRELRGRVGSGAARINVETSSGRVRIF